MPARAFLYASGHRKDPLRRVATDTLGMPSSSRITDVWRYRARMCTRPRDCVASAVLGKGIITSATSGIVHTVWWTGSWGTNVTCLLFQIEPHVAIRYCLCSMISKPHRTQGAQTLCASKRRIFCGPAVLRCVRRRRRSGLDCRRCGKTKRSFWADPVAVFISYMFKSRPGMTGS